MPERPIEDIIQEFVARCEFLRNNGAGRSASVAITEAETALLWAHKAEAELRPVEE